jgi:hypothetical protein
LSTAHIFPQVEAWDDYPEDAARIDGTRARVARRVRGRYSKSGSVPEAADSPFVELWDGGGLGRVSKGSVKVGARRGGGKRGKCGRFGGASRRRLLRMVAKVRRDRAPYMLHLTYPDCFPVDPERWKRDRKCFEDRLLRRFPAISDIWRLELQTRKSGENAGKVAPHYHMMLWGLPGPSLELYGLISRLWYEVVGSGDLDHLLAGTRLERVRSWRGVMSYCAKYLSKEAEACGEYAHVGRWWGVRGAESLPWADCVRYPLTYAEACRVVRLFRRAAGFKGRRAKRDYVTLSVFLDGTFWVRRLCEALYPA